MGNYPLFKVHVDTEDALDRLRHVFESGFINEGVQVSEFTAGLRTWLGSEQLLAVNSCTSAITLALKIAGVGPDTEVISTPMTCIASNTPIVNLGGRIVWADIDPYTGSIEPDEIEKLITPKTKAVICVAWAGTPCDLEALNDVCKKSGVALIQDAAHAFGATYQDHSVSAFADFTCYSFQAIKHISCGDGGALVCRDPADFALAKKLKWFGYDRDAVKNEKGEWKGQRWSADILEGEVGFKFNMNNVAAAIGLSQLPHAERILSTHRRNATIFAEAFAGTSIRPLKQPENSRSSFWVYTVLLTNEAVDRDTALEQLNAEGIGAGQVHVPNDDYSCFAAIKKDLPGVHYFSTRQISLPCGWWITENDARHIADRVKALCA